MFEEKNIRIRRVLLLTNCLFVVQMIAFFPGDTLGKTSEYINLLMVIAVVVFSIRHASLATANSRIASIIILLVISGLLVYGFIDGNWWKFIGMDCISFSTIFMILLFHGNQDLNTVMTRLPDVLCNMLVLGVPISLIAVLLMGLAPGYGDVRFNMDADAAARGYSTYSVIVPLIPAYLLSPFAGRLRPSQMLLTLFALLMLTLVGIWTATRGTVLTGLACSLLTLFSIPRRSRKFGVLSIILLGALILVTWQAFWGTDSISDSFLQITGRFLEERDSSESLGTARTAEAEALFQEYSGIEWIFGRGIGGAHKGWIWLQKDNGASGMHYGAAHLMLKGGLLWLVCVYGLIFISVVVMWKKGGEFRKFALFLIIFIGMDSTHNQWGNGLFMIFVWVYVGIGLFISSPGISVSTLPSRQWTAPQTLRTLHDIRS